MNQYRPVFLWDRDRPESADLGYARFDPEFPGAYPFKASSPEMARCLLEYCYSRKSSDRNFIQVFVEGNPALVNSLIESGAEIYLRVLRMEGQIPNL